MNIKKLLAEFELEIDDVRWYLSNNLADRLLTYVDPYGIRVRPATMPRLVIEIEVLVYGRVSLWTQTNSCMRTHFSVRV